MSIKFLLIIEIALRIYQRGETHSFSPSVSEIFHANGQTKANTKILINNAHIIYELVRIYSWVEQGRRGGGSERTELRPCSCNQTEIRKFTRLFVDHKLRISSSLLIINFAYLWNFTVSPRYALAEVLQLPINLM